MRKATARTTLADNMERADSARRGARLTVRKKLLFAVVTVVGFFAAVELLLAVCGVRPSASTRDPFIGFSAYAPLFIEAEGRDGSARMVTAPGKLTWFNEQEFPSPKPAGVFRIFCLGGSTTYGRPYDDRTSFSGWLRELLGEAAPGRKFEVINVGGISYASYRVARLMEELVEYEPDLFIIYTGHNEFLERRTYGGMLETPEAVRGAAALLARTRTWSALRSVLRREPEPPPRDAVLSTEVLTQLDSVVGLEAYHRDETFRRQVLAHFRFNLNRMIAIARAASADVIVVTPSSNLGSCSPFKSEHPVALSARELQSFDGALEQGLRDYAAGDYESALGHIDQALQIDDVYAEALYRRGRTLLALGRSDEARQALLSARDEDVCPLRALSAMESLVREAAEEQGVPLVDFNAIVTARSPNGIPGDESFLDHVHPTIDGHGLLAAALLQELVDLGVVERREGWSEANVESVAARIHGSIEAADQAAALRNLSKVLGWAGKPGESAEVALRAVEINPDDAEAQYEAGNALYTNGNLEGALARYETSLALDPQPAATYYGLGLVNADLGRTDEAIRYYREALRREPDFADAHYNLGNLLSNSGDLPGARQHYESVLRIHPEHIYAGNNLGIVLVRSGELDAAQAAFERALETRPDFVDALLNLGRVHEVRGATDIAARCYRQVLRLQPDHPSAVSGLERIESN